MRKEKVDFVNVDETVFYDDQSMVDNQFPGLRQALRGVVGQIQKGNLHGVDRTIVIEKNTSQFRVKPYQRSTFIPNPGD